MVHEGQPLVLHECRQKRITSLNKEKEKKKEDKKTSGIIFEEEEHSSTPQSQ
jgi:hypothetical protein